MLERWERNGAYVGRSSMKRMLGCSLCMRWGARALSGDDPSWDNVIAWGGGSIGATKKPLLAGEMMSEEEFLNMA